MTIGEAAAASFGPSNHWTKINKTKFVVALGGRQSTIAHNNQPTYRGHDGEGTLQGSGPAGTQGEQYSIVLGAVELGGGRE